jgi:tetratricopeptide (TPR) repeat protein
MMASSEVELAQRVDALRRCYELSEAEGIARSALERFPESVELLIALGRVLMAAHRLADAVTIFEQAVKLASGDDRPVAWRIAALSRQYSFAAGIAAGTDALEHHPGSALIRVALGRVFLDSSQPQEALVYLAGAAAIAPADETALSWQAACLAEMYKWQEAEALARESLRLHTQSIKLHYRLGRVLLGEQCFTEAKDCFDAVLARAPQDAHALERRTTALRCLLRFGEAAASAADAISRVPRAPWLHVEYGWVFGAQDALRRRPTKGRCEMTGYHTRWARPQDAADDPERIAIREALAFGKALYDIRTALGLTVAELATRAALTDDDIERIEEGGTEPTIPLLRRLAAALNADVRLTGGHDLGSVWFETHAA